MQVNVKLKHAGKIMFSYLTYAAMRSDVLLQQLTITDCTQVRNNCATDFQVVKQ
jgi:hypothetical protein